jgi:YbbR domain-containing protein
MSKVTTTAPGRSRPRLDFLRPDFSTLLLSIVLALIVWWIAINQENPLVVQDFQQRVPVSVLGLGDGLVVVEDLSDETVKLRLRAPRTSWENMDVTDFRATIDLTGLEPGQHDVAVQVKSLDPQVTIVDVQRPQLRVTLDPSLVKDVPVQVEIMDGTAFGYDAQPAVYSPMTVTVSGPASQVQQVTKARTEVYLRGAKSQVERVQNVVAVDAQNQPVARVTSEPTLVQVVVPVEQWPGRKEVAVRVKLSGRPADGYRLSSVKVDPSTVVLQGESDVLAQVPGYVETEPLTLAGVTSEVRLRLKLILPAGVTSFDGDTVVATAGITPIEGGVTISQPLVQQGLGQGLSAQSALQDVDVILSGPLPLLDSLNQDDLFAILDLTGLISGTHSIKPKVVLPDGIQLEGVIPETVEVVITAREGAAFPSAQPLPALPTNPSAEPTMEPTNAFSGTIPPLTPTPGSEIKP